MPGRFEDRPTYSSAGLTIGPVMEDDVPAFMELMTEYGRSLGASGAKARFTNTRESIEEALFSEPPKLEAIIARYRGEPVGLASWGESYHLMSGRLVMEFKHYYVQPQHRARPFAISLLAYMLNLAVRRGYWRVEGRVGAWNKPVQRMYAMLRARRRDHVTFRIEEAEIAAWASWPETAAGR
jgi:GNAT superfamily N-acetyltransferase